jgi:hypothetical protein
MCRRHIAISTYKLNMPPAGYSLLPSFLLAQGGALRCAGSCWASAGSANMVSVKPSAVGRASSASGTAYTCINWMTGRHAMMK